MGLFAGVKSFLVEKFWIPIVNESVFYNPFNTAVYSVLFALAAAYIGWPLLKKLDIELDREFFIGITPFVFLGGSMRSLKDINAVNSILLETPFIYLLMFGIVIGSLIAARKLSGKTEFEMHKILGTIGSVLLLASLSFYSISNTVGFLMIIGIIAAWSILIYLILKLLKPELLKPEFYLPIAAHYLDASVTSVALTFPGTAEKHVLARFFIDLLGPYIGMFSMKTMIIVPAVYYVNKEVEGQEKLYYLFLIAVLGTAIATRNFLSFVTLTG